MTIFGLSLADWILVVSTAVGLIAWLIRLERSVDALKAKIKDCQGARKDCLEARERQHGELRHHTDERYDRVIQLLLEIQQHLGILNGRTGGPHA